MVAMKGKDCVVIASDMRYGIRFQTVATNFPKIYRLNSRVLFFTLSLLFFIILSKKREGRISF